MMIIWQILGWLFSLLFGFLFVSMLMLNNWVQAILLLFLIILCLPPANSFIASHWGLTLHPVLRFGLLIVLLFAFSRLLLGGEHESVYASPETRERFIEIYDEKMTGWGVPYEDIYLDTKYGKVHVIASGAEDNPPMLLLHASMVSSWSWKFNAGELSRHYRIYAVDLIGDPGKSEYDNLDNIMKTGKDQADFYAEISDMLGIDKLCLVGASEGGFIATNYALHYPERVEKMALMGPMGYSGATQSIIRITITQMFPLKAIQDSTFKWAFSDSAVLKEEYEEWFPLVMTGIVPAKVAPLAFSAEERQSLQVPVMFIFGEKDHLVGNPEAAREKVQDIPDVRVEIVDAGHLMGGESPDECNRLLIDFFGSP